MLITYWYQGVERIFESEATQVVVGRPREGVTIHLDLTPDIKVSRPHARICIEDDGFWVEDLNSARGTQVDGQEIKGLGRHRLLATSKIMIGDTSLQVSLSSPRSNLGNLSPAEEVMTDGITESLDAVKPAFSSHDAKTEAERRLALLYEISVKFGEEAQFEDLLKLIVERVVLVIAGAKRGALLTANEVSGELLLAASFPADSPAVSTTLATKAMERRAGFLWSRPGSSSGSENDLITGSAFAHSIQSAIYVPLMWKGKALGVICLDNDEKPDAFQSDDLQLLQALAHLAAGTIAHLNRERAFRHEAKILNNFLKLVSPPLAERLKQYQGQIRPGGEFREATIVFSDMRGFAKLSSQMEPEDVAAMLEDYFGSLVPIVSRHKGMVDKYVGDAIVAVFGSPKADEHQHSHAVQAALEMQRAVVAVNARRSASGQILGELGIGIHCGEVIHGFIGTPERMEFTVIGDAVNRASRICDGAGRGEILISPEMYQRVWNQFKVEQTTIPTKHEGNLIAYRVLVAK